MTTQFHDISHSGTGSSTHHILYGQTQIASQSCIVSVGARYILNAVGALHPPGGSQRYHRESGVGLWMSPYGTTGAGIAGGSDHNQKAGIQGSFLSSQPITLNVPGARNAILKGIGGH